MSGFPILDLVVGLIFIYFLLSIISSSALEIVMTVFKIRAVMLEKWLLTIFSKTYIAKAGGPEVTLGKAIMNHCSVTALSGPEKATSYIDAKNFASALLERITYDPTNLKNFATLADSIPADIDSFVDALNASSLLDEELRNVFLSYAAEAKQAISATESKIDIFRKKIESWYDTSMDRVSGAMKTKYTRRITFALAIVTAVALNADSISIAKYLYNNPEARVKLAAKAYAAVDSANKKAAHQPKVLAKDTSDKKAMDSLQAVIRDNAAVISQTKASLDDSIPLGWKKGEINFSSKIDWGLLFRKVIGLFATVLAIMMGAPFWFDLLNKISNLRGSGAKPASATDKKKTS